LTLPPGGGGGGGELSLGGELPPEPLQAAMPQATSETAKPRQPFMRLPCMSVFGLAKMQVVCPRPSVTRRHRGARFRGRCSDLSLLVVSN
jgi:hypothetical protein